MGGKPQTRLSGLHLPPVAPVVRFGAMGVAFLLGTWGFAQAYAQAGIASTLMQDGLRALRLIVGSFPLVLEGRDLPLALNIARWALPLLTFWSTAALAWEQVRNPLRLALIRARGGHLVIAGDADGGVAAQAATGALADGRRVLIWAQDRRATWIGDALEAGAAEVQQDAPEDSAASLALDKARAVLLLASEARANIALASAVLAQAGAVRPAGDPLDVILRVDDPDLRRSIEQRFAQGDRRTARVRLAALPDIAARQLALARPIDGFVRVGQSGRGVLVIGFSPLIERFVLRTLAGGHYRDGGKPAFAIHLSGAAEAEGAFRARHPGADALAPVRFVEARTDPARVAVLIDAHVAAQGEPVAILIDLADDDRALAVALAVDARYRAAALPAPPIHVRMAGAHDHRIGAGLLPFGAMADLADPDALLQDRHDALARSIHDFYLEGRFTEGERIGARASMQEWEDLPESFRDDNRLVADCYSLKLRDIGARLVDGDGPGLLLDADELEQLSRAEHDRWMAAKLVQGWTHGPVRDDARRLHPDIVPYDDLSEAIKDLDREQVRIMARLLSASGRRALRGLTIALTPGGDAVAADPAAVLDALATRYPDRAPIFLGDLADPWSRAMLAAVQARGALVQLTLRDHAQAILDGLPGGAARVAAELIAAADRIHAVPPGDDWLAAQGELRLAATPGDDARAIVLAPDGAILRAPWIG
ncbi:RyR domain-containing protein [Sphingobium sp. HBC34]|uniref:RyR domain-containing protein n=1 Tax=Sphingobium cyanobacteriorum TaxID=3063954 RepID=A0ABT8ZPS8_9SPHN|nr:RyR domain-containing protein [Sphingobium sp. HBC34]MDO7836550.1 RyR domain-containing protein [Sphingobium sp. HBC34]